MFCDQLTRKGRQNEMAFIQGLRTKALEEADLPVTDYRVLSFFALEVRANRGDQQASLEMDRRRNS